MDAPRCPISLYSQLRQTLHLFHRYFGKYFSSCSSLFKTEFPSFLLLCPTESHTNHPPLSLLSTKVAKNGGVEECASVSTSLADMSSFSQAQSSCPILIHCWTGTSVAKYLTIPSFMWQLATSTIFRLHSACLLFSAGVSKADNSVSSAPSLSLLLSAYTPAPTWMIINKRKEKKGVVCSFCTIFFWRKTLDVAHPVFCNSASQNANTLGAPQRYIYINMCAVIKQWCMFTFYY